MIVVSTSLIDASCFFLSILSGQPHHAKIETDIQWHGEVYFVPIGTRWQITNAIHSAHFLYEVIHRWRWADSVRTVAFGTTDTTVCGRCCGHDHQIWERSVLHRIHGQIRVRGVGVNFGAHPAKCIHDKHFVHDATSSSERNHFPVHS